MRKAEPSLVVCAIDVSVSCSAANTRGSRIYELQQRRHRSSSSVRCFGRTVISPTKQCTTAQPSLLFLYLFLPVSPLAPDKMLSNLLAVAVLSTLTCSLAIPLQVESREPHPIIPCFPSVSDEHTIAIAPTADSNYAWTIFENEDLTIKNVTFVS